MYFRRLTGVLPGCHRRSASRYCEVQTGACSSVSDNTGHISERNVVRLLRFGFFGMVGLVALVGAAGVQTIVTIRNNFSALSDNQFRTVILIDEVQRAQTSLSSVIYALSVESRRANPAPLRQEIDNADRILREVFARIPAGDPAP